MDLSTTYLGLTLPHPLMAGASPLVDDLDAVRQLEDAGTSAIVMHSLFEEQIEREYAGTIRDLELHANTNPEGLSYLPAPHEFALGPHAYLEQIRRIKEAVAVPVIASLNGTTATGWLDGARLMEQAGADALELNVYEVVTDPLQTAETVEQRIADMVRAVKARVKIPVAVKLSPFSSSLPNFAHKLQVAGADGLVLFNRILMPDFDLEQLELVPKLMLSNPSELPLRLNALAILHGAFKGSLACSGGIHDSISVLKAVFAGASSVQVVSALLQHGPSYLQTLREGMEEWLEQHEYENLRQGLGSMDLVNVPNPHAFYRASYMRVLQGWRPELT
ncbi:MAG: dihydroorotate dehydrogenase-like protein [Holophagaceae bacterium]|nr:dihydroorotate dehydrogenase-like protein [Holophagaceae bacterium]